MANGGLYLDSGRGFTLSGEVKPDFCAPAVNVYGPGLRNRFVTMTGTSAAAAITAGGMCADHGMGTGKKKSDFHVLCGYQKYADPRRRPGG